MKVVPIRGDHESWQGLLAGLAEEWPGVSTAHGIFVLFDEDGVRVYVRADEGELALAGARLSYLAAKDD